MLEKVSRLVSALLPPMPSFELPPLKLPDDYRDPDPPTPDELGRLAWEAGGGAVGWETLNAVELDRWREIAAAVFEAGMAHENTCILARVAALGRKG